MLGYELRKIALHKPTLLFLLFLLVLNAIVIFKNHSQADNAEYAAYLDVYADIRGKEIDECKTIVAERYEALAATVNEDEQFLYSLTYDELLTELEEIGAYEGRSDELSDQSMEKSEQFQSSNAYLSALNARYAELYEGRRIDRYYNLNGIPELIGYKFHYILIILLLIAVIPNIFADEKARGTYESIKTTGYGDAMIAPIKVAALLIFAAVVTVCFTLCNLACFEICYRFDGLSQPIYAIPNYRELPANDTIALFLLKSFGLGLLAICVISLTVLLISLLFRDTKIAFAGSVCLTVGLIFCRGMGYLGVGQTVNLLNPIHWLLGEKIMLYFDHIRIGSTVIPNTVTVTVIALAETALLIGLISILYKRNIAIGGKNG